MPKSKEFVSDSGSGSEDEVPKKKTKVTKAASKSSKEEAKSDSNDNLIELGKKKFVSVGEFRGTKYVNIREYYESDGSLKPGKKGIALSADQWNKLKEVLDKVDKALEEE